MAGEKVENIQATKSGERQKRQRSTIEFPYGDLNDAISVAMAIHSNAGLSCSTEQLSGFMRQSVSSGAFRLKVASAGTFGLTENERGRISLTDLGRRIVNPAFEVRARGEAFLTVPLYKEIYAKYKGHMLPPSIALEREMLQLGVSSKQTDKARQAFERSADQAGFFAHGSDRLVPPVEVEQPQTAPIETASVPMVEKKGAGSGDGGDGNDQFHPFIRGLLETLPQAKTEWKAESRAEWLQAAAQVFKLIYKGDTDGTVTVAFKKREDNVGSNPS